MVTLKWESYFIFSIFVFSVANVVSSRQKDTCWISPRKSSCSHEFVIRGDMHKNCKCSVFNVDPSRGELSQTAAGGADEILFFFFSVINVACELLLSPFKSTL